MVIKASPEIQSDKASMGRVHFPFLYFFVWKIQNSKFFFLSTLKPSLM